MIICYITLIGMLLFQSFMEKVCQLIRNHTTSVVKLVFTAQSILTFQTIDYPLSGIHV